MPATLSRYAGVIAGVLFRGLCACAWRGPQHACVLVAPVVFACLLLAPVRLGAVVLQLVDDNAGVVQRLCRAVSATVCRNGAGWCTRVAAFMFDESCHTICGARRAF